MCVRALLGLILWLCNIIENLTLLYLQYCSVFLKLLWLFFALATKIIRASMWVLEFFLWVCEQNHLNSDRKLIEYIE